MKRAKRRKMRIDNHYNKGIRSSYRCQWCRIVSDEQYCEEYPKVMMVGKFQWTDHHHHRGRRGIIPSMPHYISMGSIRLDSFTVYICWRCCCCCCCGRDVLECLWSVSRRITVELLVVTINTMWFGYTIHKIYARHRWPITYGISFLGVSFGFVVALKSGFNTKMIN